MVSPPAGARPMYVVNSIMCIQLMKQAPSQVVQAAFLQSQVYFVAQHLDFARLQLKLPFSPCPIVFASPHPPPPPPCLRALPPYYLKVLNHYASSSFFLPHPSILQFSLTRSLSSCRSDLILSLILSLSTSCSLSSNQMIRHCLSCCESCIHVSVL